MKRKTWVLMAALMMSSLVTGCNTVNGAGKDIERGGEKIQEQAK